MKQLFAMMSSGQRFVLKLSFMVASLDSAWAVALAPSFLMFSIIVVLRQLEFLFGSRGLVQPRSVY